MVVGEDLEQLRLLLWNHKDREITEEEAREIYEANHHWVDRSSMSEHERRLFDHLVSRHGKGFFHG